ncbi:MAG: hypothetical protein AB1921_03970 [Thermodesulfobacteriota bacterium]
MKGFLCLLACGAALILGPGCATYRSMEKGLDALVGKNISAAYGVMGYPSEVRESGQDRVYSWARNVTGIHNVPQAGPSLGKMEQTPLDADNYPNQSGTVQFSCLIRLTAGPDEVIRSWSFDGNADACGGYPDKLDRYYRDHKR